MVALGELLRDRLSAYGLAEALFRCCHNAAVRRHGEGSAEAGVSLYHLGRALSDRTAVNSHQHANDEAEINRIRHGR